jgi:hypothetical protein
MQLFFNPLISSEREGGKLDLISNHFSSVEINDMPFQTNYTYNILSLIIKVFRFHK